MNETNCAPHDKFIYDFLCVYIINVAKVNIWVFALYKVHGKPNDARLKPNMLFLYGDAVCVGQYDKWLPSPNAI